MNFLGDLICTQEGDVYTGAILQVWTGADVAIAIQYALKSIGWVFKQYFHKKTGQKEASALLVFCLEFISNTGEPTFGFDSRSYAEYATRILLYYKKRKAHYKKLAFLHKLA